MWVAYLAEKRVDKHIIYFGLGVISWEDIIINTCGKRQQGYKEKRTGIQARLQVIRGKLKCSNRMVTDTKQLGERPQPGHQQERLAKGLSTALATHREETSPHCREFPASSGRQSQTCEAYSEQTGSNCMRTIKKPGPQSTVPKRNGILKDNNTGWLQHPTTLTNKQVTLTIIYHRSNRPNRHLQYRICSSQTPRRPSLKQITYLESNHVSTNTGKLKFNL